MESILTYCKDPDLKKKQNPHLIKLVFEISGEKCDDDNGSPKKGRRGVFKVGANEKRNLEAYPFMFLADIHCFPVSFPKWFQPEKEYQGKCNSLT